MFFPFMLLFWVSVVPVYPYVLSDSNHEDIGSLDFLLETYFSWD